MKKFIILLSMSACFGESDKYKLTDLQYKSIQLAQVTIENIQLKAQRDIAKLNAEIYSISEEACTAIGLLVDDCDIDMKNRVLIDKSKKGK